MTGNPPPARSPAIPAATLILMRDRADGPPDILFVERSAAMAFAGGAIVFPGGRIDPGDRALALAMTPDSDTTDEDWAGRIAAIRETIEEAGLAVGLTNTATAVPPNAATALALRDALHDGETMGAALDRLGLSVDPAALVPYGRWRPDIEHTRVFDARFYIARAPATHDIDVDGTENVRAFWASARAVLDQAEAGQVRLIFPTRRTLERLAGHGSFAEAAAFAATLPPRTIVPWIETRDGIDHLCIPEDLGYPVTASPLNRAMRA